jgi:hypothetical protein
LAKVFFGCAHFATITYTRNRPSELIHGQERHSMGRDVTEAQLALTIPHLIG